VKTIPETLLQEIVRRLARGLKPKRIFLFGSHAYGTPAEDSDIDLLVEVPHSSEPRHRRASVAYGLLAGLGAATEIIVLTSADIEKAKEVRISLENTVLRKGRLLYG
jgi:predicted nucleotidyltransferase